MIDVTSATFIVVEVADESHGGRERWGGKSEAISTILGMQGEMSRHGRVLWSVKLLSLLLEIYFSKTGFIYFQS